MGRAERIANQLGMSQGAANNKLRKNILFSLIQRLELDFCFKCGEGIHNVNELSIEHKLPWEGRDTQLFWSLDNIAFSHLACNRPHIQNGNSVSRERPEGKAWCSGIDHKCYVPVEQFSKNRSNYNGVEAFCSACRAKRRNK